MLPASFQMLSLLFQVVDEWPFGGIGTKALVLTLAIGFDKILNKIMNLKKSSSNR